MFKMRFLAAALLVVGAAASPIALPFLSVQDRQVLQSIFESALKNSPDLSSAYFSAAGLKHLGVPVSDAQNVCEWGKSQVDQKNAESLFLMSGLVAQLQCKLKLGEASKTLLEEKLGSATTTQELYFTAAALKNFGNKFDSAKVMNSLMEAIKKDDSSASLGYAFHAGLLLTETNVNRLFDRIEDTVAQADEVDGKYLQFDGGLSVTAMAISGIYGLADKAGKAPSIKADEAIKFANYLLSRKGVQLPRPAFFLLNALDILTTNKFHVPVSISLWSNVAMGGDGKVEVKICNVLGGSVGALSVSIDAATHLPTSGVVLSRKPMTRLATDRTETLYEAALGDGKREKGSYKLSVSAASTQDKRLVGTQGAELHVKIMTDIKVEAVEVSVFDRDQAATGNVLKVESPKKLAQVLEADTHQKIYMKFVVKDQSSGQPMKVHQAFIVLQHQDTKHEIIFVAEPDLALNYKFDVDLQKSAKDFDNLSGKYLMKLIVGDAVVSNPLLWDLADLKLKFPSEPKKVAEAKYEKKPEIRHQFREPERRPPSIVSNTFTVLALAPLLVLFILWLRIGVNVSNFPFSFYALGFHAGLTGIFALYLVFWLRLNMFQTLKCLAGMAVLTAVCGNAMLRGMAERRKAKTA